MSDLISKKKLVEELESHIYWGDTVVGLLQVAMEAKPVDALEVVRCRECKHFEEDKRRKGKYRCDHPQHEWDVECFDQWLDVEPDDFCSRGERRNESALR